VQVAGVHFLVSQTHLLEHAFTQALPLQQLLVLSFALLPAIAASDSNIAVLAIKILRFIVQKINIYYSENLVHLSELVCLGHAAISGGRQQSEE
jgi:hypothetical protein